MSRNRNDATEGLRQKETRDVSIFIRTVFCVADKPPPTIHIVGRTADDAVPVSVAYSKRDGVKHAAGTARDIKDGAHNGTHQQIIRGIKETCAKFYPPLSGSIAGFI